MNIEYMWEKKIVQLVKSLNIILHTSDISRLLKYTLFTGHFNSIILSLKCSIQGGDTL